MLAVTKNLTLQGYIVLNYLQLMPEFLDQIVTWHTEGKLKWKETVFEGIETAPSAFLGLFDGRNLGKMLVKLS